MLRQYMKDNLGDIHTILNNTLEDHETDRVSAERIT